MRGVLLNLGFCLYFTSGELFFLVDIVFLFVYRYQYGLLNPCSNYIIMINFLFIFKFSVFSK